MNTYLQTNKQTNKPFRFTSTRNPCDISEAVTGAFHLAFAPEHPVLSSLKDSIADVAR